jgi:hypothetical protein
MKKSSFCSGGDCAVVDTTYSGNVRVRATPDLSRYVVFTPEEWTAFIAGVKAGEFDLEALA